MAFTNSDDEGIEMSDMDEALKIDSRKRESPENINKMPSPTFKEHFIPTKMLKIVGSERTNLLGPEINHGRETFMDSTPNISTFDNKITKQPYSRSNDNIASMPSCSRTISEVNSQFHNENLYSVSLSEISREAANLLPSAAYAYCTENELVRSTFVENNHFTESTPNLALQANQALSRPPSRRTGWDEPSPKKRRFSFSDLIE